MSSLQEMTYSAQDIIIKETSTGAEPKGLWYVALPQGLNILRPFLSHIRRIVWINLVNFNL